MIKIMYGFVALAIIAGITSVWFARQSVGPTTMVDPIPEGVMCTMDAMKCPDGSYVGRTGPKCEFVCPPALSVPAPVQASIDAHADLIVLVNPIPLAIIENGQVVSGKARGNWYFEGSFPIKLLDHKGAVLATGVATAESDWMTTEFVPFTTTLTFEIVYDGELTAEAKQGTLVLEKDNPSGLPENDDSLSIPIRFAP